MCNIAFFMLQRVKSKLHKYYSLSFDDALITILDNTILLLL